MSTCARVYSRSTEDTVVSKIDMIQRFMEQERHGTTFLFLNDKRKAMSK